MEKDGSGLELCQRDKFRGLLGIGRIDVVPDALCGVTKGVHERLMKLFSNGSAILKEGGNNRIAKIVYVWKCMEIVF